MRLSRFYLLQGTSKVRNGSDKVATPVKHSYDSELKKYFFFFKVRDPKNVFFWESKHKGKDFVKSTNKKLIFYYLCTKQYCT